ALTVQGQTTGGYTKVADKNGNITVFTNSKTIETNFNKLSKTETGAIKGANIFTRIWNGLKKGVSFVWNGIKKGASFVWNGVKKGVAPIWNGIKNFTWEHIIKPLWNNSITKFIVRETAKILLRPIAYTYGLIKGAIDAIKEKFAKDVTGSEKYNNVVDDLAKDTGLDKEYIEAMLAQLDKSTLSKAIDVLTDLYGSGINIALFFTSTESDFYTSTESDRNRGDIINCGSYTAAALLGAENEGMLAFQLFLIDIQTRPVDWFVMQGQLSSSPYALQTLLNAYGKNADIKAIGVGNFMNSLKIGENAALVCKVEDSYHYIAVTKQVDEESGKIKYVVSDNGEISEFWEEEFRNLLETGSAKDKNGNVVKYDFKFIEFNELTVISDSPSVKNAGNDPILEDVFETMLKAAKFSKKATTYVLNNFSILGRLFGSNKKISLYELAQKDLKLKQANAVMAVSMFTGVEGMEGAIEKAYQDLAKAEQNMLKICKTDKQKEDAQINIDTVRIDLAIIALKVQSKGAIEAANNALDDYISGNITFEEYQTIVDKSMAEINNMAAPIAAKIEALNEKRQAAGYEPATAQQTAFHDIINSVLPSSTMSSNYTQYLKIIAADEVKLEDLPENVLAAMLKVFSEEELQSSKIVTIDDGKHYYIIPESDSSNNNPAIYTIEDGVTFSVMQEYVQNNDYAEKYLNSLKAFDYILSALVQSYDSWYSNDEEAAAAKTEVVHKVNNIISKFNNVLITMNNAYDNNCKKMEGLSLDSDEYIALNEQKMQIETISALIESLFARFGSDLSYSVGGKIGGL
ncbi:MAG: hypothetical protein LBQ47_05070, partial [Endomicrobium sp.]|nr:hypothetical protein [Endomicrobium sp.]